jgi:HEAT repeat protein
MRRPSCGFALFFVFVATDFSLGHGGTYRAADGTRAERAGDGCGPSRGPTLTTPRFGPGGTTKRTQPPGDPTHGWEWWWEHNGDSLLLARASAFRAMATPMGATPGLRRDPGRVMSLTKDQIRCGALALLRPGLTDDHFDTRAACVIALGKILDPAMPDAPALRDAMRALLADPDREVRESACLGLGLLGDASQAHDLVLILKDDPSVRALANPAPRARVVPRQRAFAALALGLLGAHSELKHDIAAEMVDVVKHDAHQDVRVLAAIGLGIMRGSSAVPELRALATEVDGDPIVRAHAITSLARLSDTSFTAWLSGKGVTDTSSDVQRSSAIALGLLAARNDDGTAATLVRRAQFASDRPARNFSLIALGQVGTPGACAFLLERLASAQHHDRTFAAIALGLCGANLPERRDEIGATLLRRWNEVPDEIERGAFAVGLGLLGHQAAIPPLADALRTTASPRLRGHLATALGLLGATSAASLIRELAKDAGDWDAQTRARKALGLLSDPDSLTVLVDAIRTPVNDLTAIGGAAIGLALNGRKTAVVTLGEMLAHREAHQNATRAFAAVALGCLGDKDDTPLLTSVHANCNYLATTDALRELLRIY